MKVLKDNSNKKRKAKCKGCKSVIEYTMAELNRGMFERPYIDCPVCKKTIWLKEK